MQKDARRKNNYCLWNAVIMPELIKFPVSKVDIQ